MLVRNRLHHVGFAAAVAVFAGSGRAVGDMSSGSWYLDQSNTFADGVNYAQVDIVAETGDGTVEFTVQAFDVQPTYGTIGANFGLDKFGFNFENLTSTPSDWTILDLPTGWSHSAGTGSLDGFGKFMVEETGSGNSRLTTLAFRFRLPTFAEAVADNFAVVSPLNAGDPAEGSYFFVAHLGGFGAEPGSHWIGGSTVVPAPGAVVLGGIGLGLVGLMKRRRSLAG